MLAQLFKSSLLVLLLFISTTGIAHTQASETQLKPMIVGGGEAQPGEFPFIVSLYKGYHFCGGSLIDKNWVLTAAHCVTGSKSFEVRIGLFDQKNLNQVEVRKVKNVMIHPQYNKQVDHDYDFALVELDASSNTQPIELNRVDFNSQSRTGDVMFTVAGWGTLKEGSYQSPKILQKVEVPFIDLDTCEKSYPNQMSERMLCAGYQDGGKDSCQGDSGGPLVTQDASGKAILAGVVSWGKGCARAKYYGVYGHVSTVYDWIKDQIN